MFKLALIQMHVDYGDRDANLAHASELIDEAASHNADLVLLPEAMDLGWTDPSAKFLATPIPDGETCQFLIHKAKEKGLYVCSGLVEKKDDRVFNAAILVDPSGEIILHHRKINELDIGLQFYEVGDRLDICQTEFGKMGIIICADAFAKDHVLSRSLCQMGADMILSPCSWAMSAEHDNQQAPYGDTWRDCYLPVAEESGVWIAGVSNVGWIKSGPWEGRKCIGCSMVVNPDGKEVLQGPYGVDAETILYIDIETEKKEKTNE